jgi:SpoVK/Ycf46/Vps4 family AAA+-type ATPase
VIARWRDEAPALLVIEDLDWLLAKVSVSSFLNLIDGVDCEATGALLLIATSNHPDKLDPAVNHRPGRFDVVIEVPPPDEGQRFEFLRRGLPEMSEPLRRVIARRGRGVFLHAPSGGPPALGDTRNSRQLRRSDRG